MLTCPHPPPVTVLFDPTDDFGHLRAALAAHNPTAGRITIHPTIAGPQDTDTLAHDILAALGLPVLLPAPTTSHRTDRTWLTAAAWLLSYRITHLLMLRAHLLPVARWRRLLQLRARTGVHLSVVCHRPALPPATERALAGEEVRCADAAALYSTGPVPWRSTPTVPEPSRSWITLPTLRLLAPLESLPDRCTCTATPPPAAQCGAFLTPALHAELALRVRAATSAPAAAAAVAVAVCTAATTTQLAACRTGDLAADAAHLILHDPNRPGRGCRLHRLPPWTHPLLDAARWLRLMATSTTAPLFTDPIDPDRLPDLTALARTCRLRSPQPPDSGLRSPWRVQDEDEVVWLRDPTGEWTIT